MRKNIKRVIVVLLILLAVFAVYMLFFKKKEEVNYITETARRGNIRQVVNATGEVGSAQLVSVGAQVSGQIERLYVQLGDEVKKGDLIAEIDSTTQQNDLDINIAKLESYQSQLQAARVALEVARSQYERERILAANNAASTESLENAENAYASARSNVTELQSLIQQTQISVNTAEVNLGYTRIVSPFDGTVVSIPVEEGQTVNANQTTPTIVQIADLSRMEILMEISEGDVTKVHPGMKVTYTVLSEPSKVYETELKSIDPGLTTLTNGSYTGVSTSDNAVYYYGRLLVPNEDGKLRIGMTTQNVIIIQNADNVIIIPTITVQRTGSRTYVNVLDNGTVIQKDIQTGLSDNLNTEVVSGLNEGDLVVSSQLNSNDINLGNMPMRMPRM